MAPKAKSAVAKARTKPKASPSKSASTEMSDTKSVATTCGTAQRRARNGGYYVPEIVTDPILRGCERDLGLLVDLCRTKEHRQHTRAYFDLISSGDALKTPGKKRRSEELIWNENGSWVFFKDIPSKWYKQVLKVTPGFEELADFEKAIGAKNQAQEVVLFLAGISAKNTLPEGFHNQDMFESWFEDRMKKYLARAEKCKRSYVGKKINFGPIGYYALVKDGTKYAVERRDSEWSATGKVSVAEINIDNPADWSFACNGDPLAARLRNSRGTMDIAVTNYFTETKVELQNFLDASFLDFRKTWLLSADAEEGQNLSSPSSSAKGNKKSRESMIPPASNPEE